ncbi:MAG: iron-containing alcohol dehydrogenase [Synergistales bacterium]|nr:iron-containing alcohol dehydrogenase [Synergistales bacterium]
MAVRMTEKEVTRWSTVKAGFERGDLVVDMCVQGFSFDEPTRLLYGAGSLQGLPEQIAHIGAASVMLVCDQGIRNAGVAEEVEAVMHSVEGVDFCTFDQVKANPLDTLIDEAYQQAQDHSVDCVVGLGGGSSLDAAKGVALLLSNGGTLRQYLMEGKEVARKIAPTVCIPTTAGTGSEVTRTIVATDHVTQFKDGFKNAHTIVPTVAILDPELMRTLPASVTAACGMDALTHAIESYITWKANPITDSLNIQAVQLIGDNIRKAYAQPANIHAKGNLLLASCMTGIAFDQAGLGIAHCMGHPLGGLFDIPHGVACAMTLPVAMHYNLIACPGKMADIAVALGENTEGMSERDAAVSAVQAVESLLKDLGLPMQLGAIGIQEEAIPKLAKDAMGFPGMLGANPRAADQCDMEQLFRELI